MNSHSEFSNLEMVSSAVLNLYDPDQLVFGGIMPPRCVQSAPAMWLPERPETSYR